MSIRAELQALMDAMAVAYRAGDAAACAALFTPDGAVFSPYAQPAHGRAAIEALHRDWTQRGGGQKRLTVLDAGVAVNLAWCLAAYSEGEQTGEGTSLSVLERQPGGAWLIRVCSLNSNDPPLAGA